jgi:hypothetical protein
VGVVVDALLETVEAVFGREDLDGDEGWALDDGVGGVGAAEDGHIGDAEACGGDLDADLGAGDDVPIEPVGIEDGNEDGLQEAVRTFSHISLLDLAVDVVAVGAVGGAEVLADRDEGGGCHGDSIA